MKKQHKKIAYKRGQAMLIMVLFVVAGSLSLMLSASSAVTGGTQDLRLSADSRSGYFLGEAGVEDVVLRLKRGLSVTQPTEVVLIGTSSSTVSLLETPTGKRITSLGASGEAMRSIQGTIVAGTGVDFAYGLHVGSSGITMKSSSQINGSVFTNGTITGTSNSKIVGDAYAVGTISSPNPSVTGIREQGADPVPMPEVDIAYWKSEANRNNDPHIGDFAYEGGSQLLGPKKIQGDLDLNNSTQLTLQGPVHITGNLNMNSSSDIFIDEGFGSTGTVVVVDGTINFNSSANVHTTSASPKGYILFVSTSSGIGAKLNSSATVGALVYAPNGLVEVNSSGKATSIVAKGVTLNSSATINYDIGLADGRFSTGPGGSFEISSWGEVE